jgi:hypothetical protein
MAFHPRQTRAMLVAPAPQPPQPPARQSPAPAPSFTWLEEVPGHHEPPFPQKHHIWSWLIAMS